MPRPDPYLPTAEEIAAKTAEIREKWPKFGEMAVEPVRYNYSGGMTCSEGQSFSSNQPSTPRIIERTLHLVPASSAIVFEICTG